MHITLLPGRPCLQMERCGRAPSSREATFGNAGAYLYQQIADTEYGVGMMQCL